jgi:hypothetical protein
LTNINLITIITSERGIPMNVLEKMKENYKKYLDDEKEASRCRQEVLLESFRADECNLEKVRYNILEIFTTLLGTAEKKVKKYTSESQEEYTAFCEEYKAFFLRIPESWQKKYEYAVKYNLTEDRVIEEIKLTEAKVLLKKFEELIKEQPFE